MDPEAVPPYHAESNLIQVNGPRVPSFFPGVSSECETKDGLHINEDLFYPEIIDPETGEVVVEAADVRATTDEIVSSITLH